MIGLPKGLKNIRRLQEIARVLGKHGFGMIFENIHFNNKKYINHPEKHLKCVLEELGGAFVKLGQLLSLRPDLIPPKYCIELEKLQESNDVIEFNKILKVLKNDSSKPLKLVYHSMDIKPLAVGSIAQVHLAELVNSKKVVVKIMKPNVRKQFEEDFEILEYLSLKLKKYLPKFIDSQMIFNEFKLYTKNELDFYNEIENLRKFKDDKKFKIPKVFEQFSGKEVVVMEYLDGISLSKKPYAKFTKAKKEKLANDIATGIMHQIFVEGRFHADPHPGNIFLMKDNSLGLIDFGIVGFVDEQTKTILTLMLYSLVEKNLDLLVKSIQRLGIEGDIETEEFKEELEQNLHKYYDVGLDTINFSELIEKIISIGTKYEIRIPKKLVMLSKCVATVESVCQQISPSFNFVKTAKPFLKENLPSIVSAKLILNNLKKELVEYGELFLSLPKDLKKLIEIERNEEKNSVKIEESLKKMEVGLNFIEIEFILSLFAIAFMIVSFMCFFIGMNFISLFFMLLGMGLFGIIILFIFKKVFFS